MRFVLLSLLMLLGGEIYAADFLPKDAKSMFQKRPSHWLDRDFDRRLHEGQLHSGCAIALSAAGQWVTESFFYLPETQIEMGLRLAEGGAVWNSNPYEYQFAFPPAVFAGLGARLFKAYSRLPVTYLALTQPDGEDPYRTWELLFSKEDLQTGFRGIQTLKISSDGLIALGRSKGFTNVTTLIAEPQKITEIVAILESGNFPQLRRLSLIATNISASDLAVLLHHPNFRQITELSLTMMNFGDAGMKILAESPATSAITALGLEIPSVEACPNRPTEAGFAMLLESRQWKSLTKLAIRSIWKWGPQAIKMVADWSGLERIEYLEFQDSQSETAIAHLLKSKALPRLEELRLTQTTFDDRLLDALADNSTLVSLKRVAVDLHTDISHDSILAVRTAPHLRETVFAYDIKPD